MFFDDKVNGHHLEYLHHLYEIGLENPDCNFVFVIPDSFLDVKDKFLWIESSNITFDLFDKKLVGFPEGSFIPNLKKSWGISNLVETYSKKHRASYVFLNSVMSLIPACILSIRMPIQISGIIYQIYLYKDETSSLFDKILNRIKYIILSKSKVFDRIFILNDENSATKLNHLYSTKRFVYLSDPYISLEPEAINIRESYNIPVNHKLLIHLGALEERKGTLNVLRSITKLSMEEQDNYTFFFAGKVDAAIKDEFYSLLDKIENVHVIVKDEFCSYGFFAKLCKEADAILMPYIMDGASSGIIGYASQFSTPVIATSTGLIGSLVKTYRLGYLMPNNDVDNLIYGYRCIRNGEIKAPDDSYCKTHTVNDFKRVISSILN